MPSLALIFWHESLLSLILWGEILCLFAALVLRYIGESAVRRNPDDYVFHFSRVWWTTFKQTPSPVSAPRMIDVDGDEEGGRGPLMDLVDEDAIAELGRPARVKGEEGDDGESGDAGGEAAGMRVSTLVVRVVPGQGADEVVGWVGNALKIRVMASAEGGQANKAVIELLASTLGVRGHQVQLKRGHYDEQKTLSIAGMTQGELDERLAAFS
jgi:uncharacterized protein YggU (UPF0235/DUF167 family)